MAVLSVEDAASHLSITASDHDAEISSLIDAAEALIANVVGPLEPQEPVTRRVVGAGVLVLPVAPVIAASVDGVASVEVDAEAGLIRFLDGRCRASTYDVTYTPGREEVPADLVLAVKEMVRHLWHLGHGGSAYGDAPPAATGSPIPHVVADLLAPHRTTYNAA